MRLGSVLRQSRQERGLTLRQVGDLVGVSAAYISDIEHGYRHPTSDAMLHRIAPALGVSLDEVFFAAGRLPPDLHAEEVTPEQVRTAFAAMRQVLQGAK